MRKSLRIKRVFFDSILKGEKKYEYRSCSEYYHGMFAEKDKIKSLYLYYQEYRTMVVEVLGIDIVEKPIELQNSPYLHTKEVFRIKLGKVISLKE